MQKNQPREFDVVINSPDKLLWEGRAQSISSENSKGTFDVLPEHANFITMIENKPIIVRTGTTDHTFNYENAVLSVRDGKATVYAGI
ncbi:MAG TPA: hypothetical protein VJH21_03045 [Candidatus Paceibacterota bacterium]